MGFLDLLDSVLEEVIYSGAVNQRRVLTDAKIKAHASGNTELENKIVNKRNEVQKVIDTIENERK